MEHVPLSSVALDLLRWLIAGAAPGAHRGQAPDEDQTVLGLADEDGGHGGLSAARQPDTFASHLVSSGLSREIVGRSLGHASAQITKRNAHLAEDALRKATEAFGGRFSRKNAGSVVIGRNVPIEARNSGGAASRHRERAGKLQPQAVQNWGPEQSLHGHV